MNLVSGSYCIDQNLYHLEWCPKYRYNMFRGKKNNKFCEDILHEVVGRHDILMIELSVMSDHIHTVVQLPPTMGVLKALQLLEGASSYELFTRHTHVEASGVEQRLQQASLDDYPSPGLPST